ncbi:LysR family transcriptional regulator [Pigmentiphaga sp. NML080357]|uniref:LysR family transcriptional regulator n=1 Tax=Pigmentiphaga sp. NML080357 TaxID=2008675 RepID=UPI000B40E842|nr:LysR family transcriptional regulator [Pigmentiphaga sp. NML080357]OVZ54733.1 LysR family transcriptional regulator [Pigmentiphaga sp. NML080357]
MDRFKQIESFVSAVSRGSLSAAARSEGVAPAVIGRRIDALEARLGVKLLIRTTRKISLSREGTEFFEECQQILQSLENAENSVAAGGENPKGHLRVTAPAGFGRRHVAPLLPRLLDTYPGISVTLDLNDRLVDLVNEGYDCAIRIGDLADSSLVSVRLADNRRMVVASPAYLRRHGTPRHPSELARHNCLSFGASGSQTRGWLFTIDGKPTPQRVSGTLECTDGAVLHAWTLDGRGLAWRSLWEVEDDLKQGRLVTVLDDYAPPPNAIYAVYPQRKHLPPRVRVFIDMLRQSYAGRLP